MSWKGRPYGVTVIRTTVEGGNCRGMTHVLLYLRVGYFHAGREINAWGKALRALLPAISLTYHLPFDAF